MAGYSCFRRFQGCQYHYFGGDCQQRLLRPNQETLLYQSSPKNKQNADLDIQQMEKEVIATTNAKLDMKRIFNALEVGETNNVDDFSSSSSSSILPNRESDNNNNPEYIANSAPVWKLAFVGAVTASIITYVATDANIFLSSVVFVSLFIVGIGDPIEQNNDNDDDGSIIIWGSIARLLGRQTIQSVEKSKPKIRAVVKAAIVSTDDEKERIRILEQQVRVLEEENTKLSLWQNRRLKIDDCLSDYTLMELKDIARKNNIKIGGTKSQLMMRLVENGLIDIFDSQHD